MKNLYIYSVFAFLLLGACSGSDNQNEGGAAPSVPALVSPPNYSLCVENPVLFQWGISKDPEEDSIDYEVQIAQDEAFASNVVSLSGVSTQKSIPLEANAIYYWRVKATDVQGNSSAYSSVYKMHSEGLATTNHLPFAPELVAPILDTEVESSDATLEWTAVDVDADNVLTYDLYFGTDNPPVEKVATDIATPTHAVSLEATTTYFWRVEVKDGKGGQAMGQVWSFSSF